MGYKLILNLGFLLCWLVPIANSTDVWSSEIRRTLPEISKKLVHINPDLLKIERIGLSWKSFRKTQNSNLPYIAYTAHKTFYKYRATQKGTHVSLAFEVRILLDSANTTVNYKRLQDLTPSAQMKLLQHEQGHTDLAVIYGRELYRQFNAQSYTATNFKTKTRTVYLKLMESLANENRQYDIATEHGFNDDKQKIWAADIDRRLHLTN